MTNFKSAALFVVFVLLLASYPGSSRAAPDKTEGMALLGAYVRSDASIISASGVTSVSSLGTGQYSVIFDRDVTNCIFSGTVGNAALTFLTVSPYLTPPQVRWWCSWSAAVR